MTGLLCAGLVACGGRSDSPIRPDALNIGTNRTVYAISSRASEADGTFGFARSADLSLLELTVSIPPNHEPGDLSFGGQTPDPQNDFVIAKQESFGSVGAFRQKIDRDLRTRDPQDREVSIFVHGYNATQSETAFRAAQIAEDLDVPGVSLIYSWPSRGTATGYVYDHDSMLFARDGLERMITAASEAQARRVVLVAHSMGGLLTLETLRQIDLARPGWVQEHVDGLFLISPDVDVDVFRAQATRISALPRTFVIFVSQRDPALSLSALLRGTREEGRLGNLASVEAISDLPVTVIDTTEFSKEADSAHLVPVTSPTMVAMLLQARQVSRTFDSESAGISTLDQSGLDVYRGSEER
ncbi:MAG: alpha/beta fold hydrolase [Pseudomonadota bacterium]